MCILFPPYYSLMERSIFLIKYQVSSTVNLCNVLAILTWFFKWHLVIFSFLLVKATFSILCYSTKGHLHSTQIDCLSSDTIAWLEHPLQRWAGEWVFQATFQIKQRNSNEDNNRMMQLRFFPIQFNKLSEIDRLNNDTHYDFVISFWNHSLF